MPEFGNPPLGTQFITSNPNAGLDWPVRPLVTQDDDGSVWTVDMDFGWIAKRHLIIDRRAQFKMATEVIGSITSSVARRMRFVDPDYRKPMDLDELLSTLKGAR
jgi:uncharacterized protein (DUF302 family)